ncbi:class I SAM-dependent methyltransferase [Candidatus Pelagibacter sp.]|nr:class I SAM-dependent methyltransferase [Candidatus Pelagibacter sp.]
MKFNIKKKPRIFTVGFDKSFIVKDFGKINVDHTDKEFELLTFSNKKKEYDFGITNWGYYATPSINGRLKNNGYQTFLVKNIYNKIYIMVVDDNKLIKFRKYIEFENQKILSRLDLFENEDEFIKKLLLSKKTERYCKNLKCLDHGKNIHEVFKYIKKPPNEPNYYIKNYKRKVVKCQNCNHFFAIHKINTSTFYKENYSIISHGKNISKKFNKIKKLKSQSDNFHRVNRFLNFFKKYKNKRISLLDVGSGLSIFLNAIKHKVRWNLIGIEPDINFVKFGKEKLGLNIIHSNLNIKKLKNKKFEIISLNKVAEHVKNPILFLKQCKNLLKKNGYIYIEVPDGLTASKQKNAKYQEEFAIDHLHVFSLDSLNNSLYSSGFEVILIDKIKEKSGKFTLYAFAKKIK